MSTSRRNFGLDIMRAAAILMVVFSHYFSSTPFEIGGVPGVEIFFVLSGFLIGDILMRSFQKDGVRAATLCSFWAKRWFRTLPNYAVFLFFHLCIGYWIASHLQANWYLYVLFLQNFFGPMPGFFQESWSLAVEEWFYLLFPLLLVVLNRGPKLRPGALLAVMGLFLVIPVALRWYASRFWDFQTIRMVVPLHLDTVMYGVMAAIVLHYRPQVWLRFRRPAAFSLAAIVFLFGVALVQYESRFSSIFSFIFISMGAALAIPFLRNLSRTGTVVSGVIEYVSKVSYSTYLLHMPFFFFIDGLVDWGHFPWAIKLGGRMLMIVAVLLLSYLPYRLIEVPFLELRERLLKK